MSSFKRLAVIGDPVSHSLSPAMHGAALRVAGIAGEYKAIHLRPSELAGGITRLRAERYTGFNVTIPHKEAVRTYLDEINESAQIGAVNTVVNRDNRLIGYNTDVEGFALALHELIATPRGLSAVVLGAGGSARAVVHTLLQLQAVVTVVNRTIAHAERLAAQTVHPITVATSTTGAANSIARADLIVNTTPLGMGRLSAESPLPPGTKLSPPTAVFDLVYLPRPKLPVAMEPRGYQVLHDVYPRQSSPPATTPLLQQARLAGCPTMDGLEMLVRQGALSFQLWTGVEPDLQTMREACVHAPQEIPSCSVS